ncbi:MAG: DUF4442 domain-containing protein [Bacteroidetes bacterium]|nr:DUF4442 domain-containing protein [Bacteroidota bacterium]
MDEFFKLTRNPLRFRLYLLTKLPSAFFSGLRITQADPNTCTVEIPFKYFTKNPFRSTYFACLSMAAEMSTGILAMSAIYKRTPKISMLVTGLEASFHKKAATRTSFRCEDGPKIHEAIQTAITTGQPQTIKARSIGTGPSGETIAEFFITWSFKVSSKSKPTP